MLHFFLKILLGIVAFSALQAASATHAETVLFGPSEFTTNWGGVFRPRQVFTAPAQGEGILRLEKVTPGKKIRAGHIFLNRKHYSLNKFLRSTDLIYEIPIQLAEKNRFLLALGGKKGAVLRLTLVGQYGPEILNFSTEPTAIREGEAATLSWATQDSDSVSISPEVGQVSSNGSILVSPIVTTTYALLATNDSGTSEASATIIVLPPPPTILFSVTPAEITKNETATLSWQVINADNVSLDQGIGTVDAAASISISPNSSTTYTLTVANAGGTSNSSVTVIVVPLKITIIEPQDLATVPSRIVVYGLLDTSATYATVVVNGQRAAVEGKTFFVNELELSAGDNEISVIGSDSDRNQATTTISVFVEAREPEISLTIGDPIGFAPFNTTLQANLSMVEIAADSAMLVFDGPGDVESNKLSDTTFELTFPTPGLYTTSYLVTDITGVPLNAKSLVTVKPAFTPEDWQNMQDNITSLEEIYRSQVGTLDIDTLRQRILTAAHGNQNFSSATLSDGAICLIYKGLIPIILDLPDPYGPATEGSSGPSKTARKEAVK